VHKGIIDQHVMAVADARNGNNNWAGVKGRAETRFAFRQRGLCALAFRDVGDERLNDLPPAPLDASEIDLQKNLLAVRIAGQPVESRAAVGHALLDEFACEGDGAFSVRLEGWGKITWMFAQQFVRGAAAQNPHSGGIDFQHFALVVEYDALARALEQRAIFRF